MQTLLLAHNSQVEVIRLPPLLSLFHPLTSQETVTMAAISNDLVWQMTRMSNSRNTMPTLATAPKRRTNSKGLLNRQPECVSGQAQQRRRLSVLQRPHEPDEQAFFQGMRYRARELKLHWEIDWGGLANRIICSQNAGYANTKVLRIHKSRQSSEILTPQY